MHNLLLKDILIQKKTIGMSILILMINCFILKNNVNIFITMAGCMLCYIFIGTACSYDDKSEKMINSLPVKRSDIVLTKYVSIFLFLFISVAICAFILFILKFTGLIHVGSFMTFENIVEPSIAVIIFSSICFPIYFKFGYAKTRYINLGIFLLFFIIPQLLSKKTTMNKIHVFIQNLNSMPEWRLYTGGILITFIILLISFLISYFAYKNREFN